MPEVLRAAPGRAHQPGIRCAGVSLNTARLDPDAAQRLLEYDSSRDGWDDVASEPAYVSSLDADSLDADGKVAQIRMKAVSQLADFSYGYHDLLFEAVPARYATRTTAAVAAPPAAARKRKSPLRRRAFLG